MISQQEKIMKLNFNSSDSLQTTDNIADLLSVEDAAGVLGEDGVEVVGHLGEREVWDPRQGLGLVVEKGHDGIKSCQQLFEFTD